MCRLFAMSAGESRAKATFWLLDAPDSLSVQSHREPDGTGLGWFDADGRPCVSKQPLAAYEDEPFARRAQDVCSRTFIAHVRFASTGSLAVKNTHPFQQDGRLFAHNGVIGDLPALEAQLGEDLARVSGDTDSERLFALITREVAARGGDVESGIAAACGWAAEHLPLYAINFILTSADAVWGASLPADARAVPARAPRGQAARAQQHPGQSRQQRARSAAAGGGRRERADGLRQRLARARGGRAREHLARARGELAAHTRLTAGAFARVRGLGRARPSLAVARDLKELHRWLGSISPARLRSSQAARVGSASPPRSR
jgi:predicted glutamine amidotransferase